ncbi:3-oxoacyl-[acyl-carrier-protein] synthase III C-terminal domain-containing protein [Sphaerisporangium sp. TRM90804]|uniref:3-oxoacyl-[acyl-carrier-protein] synthase III C-terminal domain-containing protein n=1 Tax=Sphaerisporangium sp. TRM90804 TaxID=3031113 RepID=UPI00244D0EC6|nr:3-oxoacyl-[acyl-carrier-protein] synthase III C-terminal domain-containing protein [Sphaerisporangium sp. TRM90804]MDH2428030.1 3-oxoacyl-[acyl-carrier-protein] synthase III C-terminal domain-containing protein [Sphaerisporangium sp. TRM90804]
MRLSPPLAEPPGIAAAVAWLPPGRHTIEDALAGGLDERMAARLGYRSLCESADHSAPEMAVLAAQKALADAGWDGDQLGMVAHSWLYHQGHDFWSPPHYVAHQVGARNALPVGVQQTSNGCVAALEVAVTRMIADPDVDRVLVTTADRFSLPGFDKWTSDFDVAYGDGATALLLDRAGGPYRLLSIVSMNAPEFELLHRGDDAFSAAPLAHSAPIDVRRTKQAFRNTGGIPLFGATLHTSVQQAVRQAIAESGLTPEDPRLRCLTLPRIGAEPLARFFTPALEELGLRHTEILELGRDTGHLGAGDSVANLADLDAGNVLAPGEVALLLNTGNGFTWSCIAVRRE